MECGCAFEELDIRVGAGLFKYDGVHAFLDKTLQGFVEMRKIVYAETGAVLPRSRIRDQSSPNIGDDVIIMLRNKTVWRETFDANADYAADRAF